MKRGLLLFFVAAKCLAQDAEPSSFAKQVMALRDAAAWRAKIGALAVDGDASALTGQVPNAAHADWADGASYADLPAGEFNLFFPWTTFSQMNLGGPSFPLGTFYGKVALTGGTTIAGSAPFKWTPQNSFLAVPEPGAEFWNTNSSNPLASRLFTDIYSNKCYYVLSPSNGMTILTNGCVGIGTNNPGNYPLMIGQDKFHVDSSGNFTGGTFNSTAGNAFGSGMSSGYGGTYGRIAAPGDTNSPNVITRNRADTNSVLRIQNLNGACTGKIVEIMDPATNLVCSISGNGVVASVGGFASYRTNTWTLAELGANGFGHWNSNGTGTIYVSVNLGGFITNKVVVP